MSSGSPLPLIFCQGSPLTEPHQKPQGRGASGHGPSGQPLWAWRRAERVERASEGANGGTVAIHPSALSGPSLCSTFDPGEITVGDITRWESGCQTVTIFPLLFIILPPLSQWSYNF